MNVRPKAITPRRRSHRAASVHGPNSRPNLEVFASHEPGTAGILAGVAIRTQHAGRDAGGPNDSPVHGR